MQEIITKNTIIKDAKNILDMHGVPLPYGWKLVMGMLLNGCNYITVEGYGKNAKLVQHITEGEEDETT